jgi:hypothetical protein
MAEKIHRTRQCSRPNDPSFQISWEQMENLIHSGVANWNGKRVKPGRPVAKIKSDSKTLAEIVSEDRD